MKILSGVVQPTSGEIYFKGEKLEIKNPDQAHKAGFSTVYQEMVQLPDMSISENIFVGRYPKKKSGLIDFKRLRSMTLELMDRLDIHFDPDLRIRSLSIAQRQLVEIIKEVSLDAEVLILDEPTSSLTTEETAILFRIINDLKQKGISIIYISHRLEDVFAIGDRAMVLRDGSNSGEGMVKDLNDSFLASIGSVIGSLFVFQGFGNWEAGAAVLSGVLAKESVVSTIGILYGMPDISAEAEDAVETAEAMLGTGMGSAFTPLSAIAFMVFSQLYTPCVTALGTIKKEAGGFKWMVFAAVYMFVLAWVVSLLVYQIGSLLGF